MTRDDPGTGTDTAVPDEGARTSARVGRRVRVLSALSGARRRSVMTAPGEAEVEDAGEVLHPRAGARRLAGEDLDPGTGRLGTRIAAHRSTSLSPGAAEPRRGRRPSCHALSSRPLVRVTSAQPKISLGNAPPATSSRAKPLPSST